MKHHEATDKCEHEYIFDERTRNMAFPPTVGGVCKKCGKNIRIKYSAYKKLKKERGD